jgi:hypothetical protein
VVVAYFTASKWAMHHKTLTFSDTLRGDRPVTVDVAIRRDREIESITEMIELPVAILSPRQHGQVYRAFVPRQSVCCARLHDPRSES